METKISVPDLQSLQISHRNLCFHEDSLSLTSFFFYINLNLCEPTVIHFQPLAHSCLQICFATEQIASFNSTTTTKDN